MMLKSLQITHLYTWGGDFSPWCAHAWMKIAIIIPSTKRFGVVSWHSWEVTEVAGAESSKPRRGIPSRGFEDSAPATRPTPSPPKVASFIPKNRLVLVRSTLAAEHLGDEHLHLLVLLVIADLQEVAPEPRQTESHVQCILKLVRSKIGINFT